MCSSPSALFRVCVLTITALFCANIASAQFDNLNDLASHITKELKPTKPRLVAVVDFRSPYGIVTPLPDLPRFSGKNLPKNTTMPGCRYCPDPSYSGLARTKRVQGTCIMEVLISKSGEPQQIRPIKLLGYGLDEQAFDVIKRWKFKPAANDGTPVATIVPVEVTFRLY